jgi:hypothetical protein
MNLYVLTQGAKPRRDTAAGFVVVAHDEDMARALAASQAGDEGPGVWASQNLSECHRIGASVVAGQSPAVLMRDFFSG